MIGQDATLVVVTLVAAVSAALLAWFAIDVGTVSLARYRARFTERARFQAQEFFLSIDPRKLFAANLAILALGTMAAWGATGSIVGAVPVAVGLAFLPRLVYRWMRGRRLRAFEQQLPDALILLAGALRAGMGLPTALQQIEAESAAPLSQEFALVLREQRLGLATEQSLNNLARRVPTQSTTLVVAAMRVANETGGGLAETLERTAHTIRARLQMEGKIGALTAQGKLQAWVVGLLPLALMAVLNRMEPEAMALLWNTRLGWGVLAVIAMLELLGVWLIRRIVLIDI